MDKDLAIPKPLIIILAIFQGITLTLLYQSVEREIWPGTDSVWLTALVTFAISFPILTYLCVNQGNIKKTLLCVLPFSLLLSLLGAYVGLQQQPSGFFNNGLVLFSFAVTSLIASFKALMYFQHFTSQGTELTQQGELTQISYSSLFTRSWRNFIVFAECVLFVCIFWIILHLGAALFAVLEIKFFKELLQESWFVIPTLNLAFGFAIIVFRNITHTADTIATILQTLIKFLLPALTLVSLGFLATLPFTGLTALWKTGSGSLLVMWLQALTLFFLNAVYQNESHQRPYPNWLHRLIYLGVALLPIYSVISAYGLWLRIDQYGLTVDRCWAILVWGLLACFCFGYLFGIIKKRDAWLQTLSTVNVRMGLIVLVSMLMVNSPMVNFQQLSADSQISRLNNGLVNIKDFDFYYFDRSLGRQGYLAMQQLKAELGDSSPEQVAIIDRMYTERHNKANPLNIDEFKTIISYWPNQASFEQKLDDPDALLEAVYDSETDSEWKSYRGNSYYFLTKDLNDDGQVEFIVITEKNHHTSANLWLVEEGKWTSHYMTSFNPNKENFLKTDLEKNKIEVVKPKWNKLRIGDVEFRVSQD